MSDVTAEQLFSSASNIKRGDRVRLEVYGGSLVWRRVGGGDGVCAAARRASAEGGKVI